MPPSSPSAAVRILRSISRARPFAWSSFYLRGRTSQMVPAPVPAALTLNLTGACPLKCAFCLARAGDGSPVAQMSAGAVADVAREVDGIDKLILMGGEPLSHPESASILATALTTARREVEVFTSGVHFLGNDPLGPVQPLLDRRDGPFLALTVAVDRDHADFFGARFPAVLDRLEAATRAHPRVKLRFNVTSPRITSRRYLAEADIEDLLASFPPAVGSAYTTARTNRAVADRFYFNPVVYQGRYRPTAGPGEYLSLADVVFNPELVVAGRPDRTLVVSSLNASWMDRPPPYTVLGEVGREGLDRMALALASRILGAHDDGLAAQVLALADEGDGLDFALELEARAVLRDLARWAPRGERFFRDLGTALWRAASVDGEEVFQLAPNASLDLVNAHVIRAFLAAACTEREVEDRLFTTLQARLVRHLGRGEVPVVRPPFLDEFGTRDDSRPPRPLTDVALDTGFGRWPVGGSGPALRPFVLVGRGVLDLGVEFLEWQPGVDPRDESTRRYLAILGILLGPKRFRSLLEFDRGESSRPLVSLLPASRDVLAGLERADPLSTEPALSDGARVFDYFMYRRNVGAVRYENPLLLRRALALSLIGFAPGSLEALRTKLEFWLAREVA